MPRLILSFLKKIAINVLGGNTTKILADNFLIKKFLIKLIEVTLVNKIP